MCDAFMTKLMKELDLEIPEFKLHRRMKVSMKEMKKGTFEVVVTGLDVHEDAPYSFIKVTPPPYIFMPHSLSVISNAYGLVLRLKKIEFSLF